MILQELSLRNFGIYQGEHTFDLTPDQNRGRATPIVLFGGINGGGKTTILDAVQLVLYGKRARCSKRGEKPYDRFLLDSINHDVDPAIGAAVKLSFRYASEGQAQLYEISRSWRSVRDNLREQVEVHRDGQIDGWLSENWNQVVEELIPYGVAQLCFFDAEKIRFLAEDETSTQALGDAIKSLLGLDLAERLIADTSVLEARLAKRVKKSKHLEHLEGLESGLATKHSECDRLAQDRAGLAPLQERAANHLTEIEDQFAKVGGKHWENREQQQRQRIELEQAVADTEAKLMNVASTEFPLALVENLLNEVATQSERERNASESEVVSRLLAERDEDLLANLKKKRISGKAVATVQEYLDSDRIARSEKALIDCWLGLSGNSRRRLGYILEAGLPQRRNEVRLLLEQYESRKRQLETIQRNLAATPQEDSIRDVTEELKQAAGALANLDQQLNRIDKQLASARTERDELKKQVARLRRKLVDEEIGSEEEVRISSLLTRTQSAMKEFLRRATAAKIDRLSQFVTNSFRYLLRKKSFIERVTIDPDSFQITLLDTGGHLVPKDRLSEGEKQVFAISVLWGLSQSSARPLPTIIDTPMGRLDVEHRNQLVERYFPNASHQVIILSTDTEIEREYFHKLEPHIARAYHLSYDESTRVTQAELGYFWEIEAANDSGSRT